MSKQREAGFTLFEMVVFIIVSAIIYSVAVNRFSDYPAAAERASFLSVITQLQSGINMELMLGVRTGLVTNYQEFQGINPMDLMLRPPSNYLGIYSPATATDLPRRSWYFDESSEELVYLVSSPDGVYLVRNSTDVPTSEIRFKVELMYRDPVTMKTVTKSDLLAGAGAEDLVSRAKMSGALLTPVVPYKWEGNVLDTNELIANN